MDLISSIQLTLKVFQKYFTVPEGVHGESILPDNELKESFKSLK